MSKYITKFSGNFPLIISVPHGGNLKPKYIPDRITGVKVIDRKTRFTAKKIRKELSKIGLTPFLVQANISRDKVDVNRAKEKGAEHKKAEEIWDLYHHSLQESIDKCREKYGKCFLIDLHGQNHTEKIELGYCLKQDELLELLQNHIPTKCSLLHKGDLSQENDLVIGKKSLGFFLEENGYPATPTNKKIPGKNKKYFSGAYITKHYAFEKDVQGLQVEINYNHVRDSYLGIKKFSKAFAKSLSEFFKEIDF